MGRTKKKVKKKAKKRRSARVASLIQRSISEGVPGTACFASLLKDEQFDFVEAITEMYENKEFVNVQRAFKLYASELGGTKGYTVFRRHVTGLCGCKARKDES